MRERDSPISIWIEVPVVSLFLLVSRIMLTILILLAGTSRKAARLLMMFSPKKSSIDIGGRSRETRTTSLITTSTADEPTHREISVRHWSTDWLISQLIDRPINRQINWLVDWLILAFIHWLTSNDEILKLPCPVKVILSWCSCQWRDKLRWSLSWCLKVSAKQIKSLYR